MDILLPFRSMAYNNAWANHRLLTACEALSQTAFEAPRTGFFPSLRATLNHILIVDRFYIDAMQGGTLGPAAWANREPCKTAAALRQSQADIDRQLITLVESLGPEDLTRIAAIHRTDHIQHERMDRPPAAPVPAPNPPSRPSPHHAQRHQYPPTPTRRILPRRRRPPPRAGIRGIGMDGGEGLGRENLRKEGQGSPSGAIPAAKCAAGTLSTSALDPQRGSGPFDPIRSRHYASCKHVRRGFHATASHSGAKGGRTKRWSFGRAAMATRSSSSSLMSSAARLAFWLSGRPALGMTATPG